MVHNFGCWQNEPARNWICDKASFDLHLIVYDNSYEQYKHDILMLSLPDI